MADRPETTVAGEMNASRLDAWIDGTAAARAQAPRKAPWFFTPAAQAEWAMAYDQVNHPQTTHMPAAVNGAAGED